MFHLQQFRLRGNEPNFSIIHLVHEHSIRLFSCYNVLARLRKNAVTDSRKRDENDGIVISSFDEESSFERLINKTDVLIQLPTHCICILFSQNILRYRQIKDYVIPSGQYWNVEILENETVLVNK